MIVDFVHGKRCDTEMLQDVSVVKQKKEGMRVSLARYRRLPSLQSLFAVVIGTVLRDRRDTASVVSVR